MELYKYVNNRNLYISYEYVCRFISQFKEVMIMSTSMFHFSSTHRKILSVSEHFGTLPRMKYPSKHFLFSKTSSAQHFLSSKTSWKRLEDVFTIRLPEISSRRLARRLQDVFKTCLQDVLQLCLEDVLEDKKMLHWRRLEDVFSTSSPRRMFAGLDYSEHSPCCIFRTLPCLSK